MGKKKLSLEVIGGIRELLDLKRSLPLVQSHLKKRISIFRLVICPTSRIIKKKYEDQKRNRRKGEERVS